MAQAAICVFTKPPLAGEAKTRLIPGIGPEAAAQLAEAFLRDTLDLLQNLDWAETIVAATAPFERSYLGKRRMWLQPEGTLATRLETILNQTLSEYPMALALGADSPGLPLVHLQQARQQLAQHDAVLGPSTDGGFYLLGVKNCPPGLLSGIAWSQSSTMQQTISRLQQQGLSVARIPEWFDVDIGAELLHLESLLQRGLVNCPHTAVALKAVRQSVARVFAAE